MLGTIIFLAIYTFLILAFVPADKVSRAQIWCKLQIQKIKDKLNK